MTQAPPSPYDLRTRVAACQREAIAAMLAETGGSIPQTLRRLGISKATLYRLCPEAVTHGLVCATVKTSGGYVHAGPLRPRVEAVKRETLLAALHAAGSNVNRAAKLMGISHARVYVLINQFKLSRHQSWCPGKESQP